MKYKILSEKSIYLRIYIRIRIFPLPIVKTYCAIQKNSTITPLYLLFHYDLAVHIYMWT